ncbi:MAG: LLM class flavin-dependent oxidoreductase [Deltaproteobacteria bacterium]|nr:LLM class flavin-dependent oxidoreductase [Deltaproteobacteria bacterium]
MSIESPRTEKARWGVEGLALGIALGGVGSNREWSRMLDWVDFAEARSLHSIWVPEMHFVPGGCSTPLLNLAAIAARSKTLRLATTSLLLPLAHPIDVARDVATLDHLTGGRLILGLGRGFPKHLFNAFEIDQASKRDRFDECLEMVLKLWAGEEWDGEEARFHRVNDPSDFARVVPHQNPHPPLAVAAFGRKGLAQAARWGLPYLASPMEPFDLIAENLAFHRAEMVSGEAPEAAVVPIMRTVFVSEDSLTLARVTAKLEAERRPPSLKLPKAIARAIDAPIDERVVVGTRDQVASHLARYRDELGMNLLIARPLIGGASSEEQKASMNLLIDEVMPSLQ